MRPGPGSRAANKACKVCEQHCRVGRELWHASAALHRCLSSHHLPSDLSDNQPSLTGPRTREPVQAIKPKHACGGLNTSHTFSFAFCMPLRACRCGAMGAAHFRHE